MTEMRGEREMKALVSRLKAEGYDSHYMRRLEAHLSVEERHETLEAEIRQEMASALGRTVTKLDHALLELELAERDLDRAPTDESWARYDLAHERAHSARRDLRIHREAIGIRRNPDLHERFPIPARRRRAH